jgi:hypothetical protein
MKSTFVLSVVGFALLGLCTHCNPPIDPEGESIDMVLGTIYKPEETTLQISATTFRSPTGPIETDFEEAEIWIAQDNPTDLKRLLTTSEVAITLSDLLPDKQYYVAAKGKRKNTWSKLSTPILIVPRLLKPLQNITLKTSSSSSIYLSPNQKYAIEQVGNSDAQETWLIDRSTGTRQKISNTEISFFFHRWSDKSNQAFFEVSRNKKRGIVAYNMATGQLSEITLPATIDMWVWAVSPDGSKVAYKDYKRRGLWVYDHDTQTEKQLSTNNFLSSLNWSADSKSLIIVRSSATLSGQQEVLQLDMQNQERILYRLPKNLSIQWSKLSPSQEHLLFSSNLSGTSQVWLYDLQKQQLYPVSNSTSHEFDWLLNDTFYALNQLDLALFEVTR